MKKLVLFTALILSATLGLAQYASNGYYDGPRGHHGASPASNHGPPVIHAMSDNDFNRAMMTIRHQRFESGKLRVAKDIASRNNLRSGQVKRIMHSFNFESSRLDFAKHAYASVVDPHRYFVVNDAFNFSSSTRDLDRFVSAQGMSGHNVYTSANGGSVGYNSGAMNGASCGTSGSMTYSGSVSTTPAGPPACGMCSGHHMANHFCEMRLGKIIRSIQKQCFDDDKLAIARQAIGSGATLMSADQVLRIAQLFTFEDTKLRFAKFAYRFTFDPENYFVVNDAFTFSCSVRELQQYIRRV